MMEKDRQLAAEKKRADDNFDALMEKDRQLAAEKKRADDNFDALMEKDRQLGIVICGCGDQIAPDDGAKCGTCASLLENERDNLIDRLHREERQRPSCAAPNVPAPTTENLCDSCDNGPRGIKCLFTDKTMEFIGNCVVKCTNYKKREPPAPIPTEPVANDPEKTLVVPPEANVQNVGGAHVTGAGDATPLSNTVVGGKAAGLLDELLFLHGYCKEYESKNSFLNIARERLGIIIAKHFTMDVHRKEDGGLERV